MVTRAISISEFSLEMDTFLLRGDAVTTQQWRLDHSFPNIHLKPRELPSSKAIIDSTPESTQELKTQRKTKIAKGIITVQLLELKALQS